MKLSIITINYNNVAGLQNTIKSVLSQVYTDFEWIVIDGASLDGSIELLKQHRDHFEVLISEIDDGIYNAMNKGISYAKGDYCFFLNSGDYLADNKVLGKVFENSHGEDILFGNLYITINGQITGRAYGKENLTFSDIYSHTIKHQASFIKRKLFDSCGMYNEKRKIVADWEFFIKTLGLHNFTYKYIDVFVSCFDNEGISNRNTEITKNERQQIILENIPLMMRQDFEFLHRYKKYENIYRNKFSFLLIRIINKFL